MGGIIEEGIRCIHQPIEPEYNLITKKTGDGCKGCTFDKYNQNCDGYHGAWRTIIEVYDKNSPVVQRSGMTGSCEQNVPIFSLGDLLSQVENIFY